MAAESGKWTAKHAARTGHEERALGSGYDEGLGYDRDVAGAAPGGARHDEPGLARGPVAPVDPAAPGTPPPPPPAAFPPPAPGTEPPGSAGAAGAPGATGAGQATVKPQPLAGKNTAVPAPGADTAPRAPQSAGAPAVPVFGAGEGERWSGRLREAVNGFVDRPRDAVAEADEVFAELAGRVTEALAEQRRVLRSGWEEPAVELDTERLRVALQSYREASERLLKL
ncbi:hypothetical protein ACFWMQ_00235 [Streptomyces sp. NPDC058372]|uniref:hypothetical protein n=1 Tax=unclassified Streptomyces TaxID=2593676 RepID=UPI0036511D85